MTPLHLAAINGSSDVILSLLNSGIDANAVSDKGWNAIHYAATSAMSSVIDPLIIAGADFDLESVFFFNQLQTPLHISAKYGATEFAEALLSFGANVDTQDKVGNTPLHIAISNSKYNTAKILLRNGADHSIRNQGGQTPEDTAPLALVNQTKAFFQNWKNWDEMVESLEFHEQEIE